VPYLPVVLKWSVRSAGKQFAADVSTVDAEHVAFHTEQEPAAGGLPIAADLSAIDEGAVALEIARHIDGRVTEGVTGVIHVAGPIGPLAADLTADIASGPIVDGDRRRWRLVDRPPHIRGLRAERHGSRRRRRRDAHPNQASHCHSLLWSSASPVATPVLA
jgi:hypothetical protein